MTFQDPIKEIFNYYIFTDKWQSNRAQKIEMNLVENLIQLLKLDGSNKSFNLLINIEVKSKIKSAKSKKFKKYTESVIQAKNYILKTNPHGKTLRKIKSKARTCLMGLIQKLLYFRGKNF